jgi:hypothetical protein
MEHCINDNLSDITYMSELILHHFRISRCYIESGGGLIRRRWQQ